MGTATYYSDNWDEIEIDLSAYAGQQGYIAIHHVSNGMYFLLIDDFGIYDEGTALRMKTVFLHDQERSVLLSDLPHRIHPKFIKRLWESVTRLLSPLL